VARIGQFVSSCKIHAEGRECNVCGVDQPWDEYHKQACGVKGKHSVCKTCRKKVRKVECNKIPKRQTKEGWDTAGVALFLSGKK
jgi:hypothetical protein